MDLRDYQIEAVNETLKAFDTHQAVLAVLATGTGKTRIACEIAKHFAGLGRVLLLAHREELIFQGKDTLKCVVGVEPEIEMADSWASKDALWGGASIVCSTYQTQIAGRDGGRMNRFDPADFSFVIADECLPAGTQVDGVAIETLHTGDFASCVDHHSGELQLGRITRTIKRKPDGLVRIVLSDGRNLLATPNHPVFTRNGYIKAGDVAPCDSVIVLPTQEDLYGLSRPGYVRPQLLGMRETGHPHGEKPMEAGESRASDLPRPVLSEHAEFQDCREDQSQVCVVANEGEKPDEEGRDQGKGLCLTQGDELEALSPGGQRQANDSATEDAVRGPRLAYRTGDPYIDAQGQQLSHVLQGRCGQLGLDDCRGDRRPLSRCPCASATRSQEGIAIAFVRVDRVEVLEPGSDGRFGDLCPDGFVYNLEIEGHNNYFANGVLVHNCHHAVSPSQRKVLDYYRKNPKLKILGLTATPDRLDEEALGQVFSYVSYEFDIWDGIENGWLVPVVQQAVYVEGLDYSSVRTTAGELNGKDLGAILEFEKTLHGMTTPILELCGPKKTLIFTATVAQAERMAEILNRHKPESAEFVCGETPKEYRRELFKRYAAGRFQYLINVGVTTEGYDCPGIEVVVMGRPTKSRAFFAQCIGRATRPLPGIVDGIGIAEARRVAIAASPKPSAEVIDFCGNAGRHKLMHAADVLGGNYSDDIVELANRNAEKAGKPVDIASELVRAEREINRRRRMREEAAIRAKIKLQSRYRTNKIDPFAALNITPWRERGYDKHEPMTDKQRACLEQWGFEAEGISKQHANQIIGKYIKDRQERKITPKQAMVLQGKGYDTTGMTMEQASQCFEELKLNNWRRPARQEVRG